MSKELTNDEINRFIHTEIMGKCWHEFPLLPNRDTEPHCLHCKKHAFYLDENYLIGGDEVCGHFNPDYCSSDSPRRLLDEVVRSFTNNATMRCKFIELIDKAAVSHGSSWTLHSVMHIRAEEIARACVGAWRNK